MKPMSVLLWLAASLALSAQPDGRAVIAANCLSCHGAAKMSGLDLRRREDMLRGGKRGPALAPGKPDESLLYRAVRREGELQMPPGKKALSAEAVAAIRAWIESGAKWDDAAAASQSGAWWSFRKPVKPSSGNSIDEFILAKLREQKLHPVAKADRRTLVRRAYFDMHGLPPTPAQVDAFVNDQSPDAWAKLIDQLLASPRYGERWGRQWLDVVRYADTGGYETDVLLRSAWRYRDYVIQSFNEDKPYNTFVQEQIAADELWPDDLELNGAYELPKQKQANLAKRIGTSLYTIGPMAVEYTFFGDQYRAEWQAEAVETTASAFLGLTMGCARCHDHKFDPLTQRDYYRMAALFAGSEEREVPIVSRMGIYEYTRYEPSLVIADQIKAQIIKLQGSAKKGAARANLSPTEKDERETLIRQLGEAYLRAPIKYATASLLAHSERVPDTHVLVRGDFHQKAEKVEPGFPAALNSGPPIDEPSNVLFIAQRRKALAEWITSPEQPLLARVMVNRIWQGHFGRGIVGTPNDFGRQGDAPSHPELLDWLAVTFAESGWSVKAMHRQIMLSDAYQRSSGPDAGNSAIDADNRYLWRMNRQRLEAESLRDAVLAASGTLNLKMGGPPVAIPLTPEERDGMRDPNQWPTAPDPAEHARRSVYLYVKRSFRLPLLETFDAPDAVASCARRESSTVASQALALMNGTFAPAQAKQMAARLRREAPGGFEAQVEAGWRLAFGRGPEPDEKKKALAFVARYDLERLCLLWFNMSEFLYVD